MGLGDRVKRGFVGRPLRSDRLGEQLLPKKLALPVFASDALSSVAYATEEILLVLSLGGLTFYHFTPFLAAAVAILMLTVVASYRQNVHAYPSGGGDYEVATTNLGPKVGLVVGSALMVDYVLTVAVSVSAGVANITSAVTGLASHRVLIAIVLVIILTTLNLRGVRESGATFAVPTYGFMLGVFALIATGLIKTAFGHTPVAESAGYHIHAESSYGGLATIFLALRAFSSGCTALTGVEAISNGVPAFKKPKSRNAATTLLLMGTIAVTMFASITALALITKVHVAESAGDLIGAHGEEQKTVIAQVASAVFGDGSLAFLYVAIVTALILILAANTAFNGFPVLGSILAQDRYLPRQLHTRGDRLAYSNGILVLASFATLLIIVFDAEVTRLIQLYIVGVFVSFVCSQTGMVRHWQRLLATETDPQVRHRMRRSQTINFVGACLTATVLVIVLITKFTRGAYIVCIAMPIIYLVMRGIRDHYDAVAAELVPEPGPPVLPTRIHGIVLVSQLHAPTLRALAYAKASHPSTLVALTVAVEPGASANLAREWEERGITIDLVELASPYREITRPILDYVRKVRRESPRDVVAVYVPEYVVGHWWEHLLHNQSALRLKARLLFQPGVMVTSVPFQLASSKRVENRQDRAGAGAARRPPNLPHAHGSPAGTGRDAPRDSTGGVRGAAAGAADGAAASQAEPVPEPVDLQG